MHSAPFRHKEGRTDYVVTDGNRDCLDCIPSALVAENIAREMNRAWQRGYAAAQDTIRLALGVINR